MSPQGIVHVGEPEGRSRGPEYEAANQTERSEEPFDSLRSLRTFDLGVARHERASRSPSASGRRVEW